MKMSCHVTEKGGRKQDITMFEEPCDFSYSFHYIIIIIIIIAFIYRHDATRYRGAHHHHHHHKGLASTYTIDQWTSQQHVGVAVVRPNHEEEGDPQNCTPTRAHAPSEYNTMMSTPVNGKLN
jgi:hypothetical protein